MSLMTSGVKIRLRPSTSRSAGDCSDGFLEAMSPSLEHQLALAGLEDVVVVELPPADELAHLGGRAEPVDGELALDQLCVGVGPPPLDAVHPEGRDLPADVDRAVVHRVTQPRADVAADDLAAALHHEAGHRGGVAGHDDRAALLVDAG